MNIQQRILLGPVVAILLLVIFGGVAFRTISSQGAALHEIKEVRFEQFKTSAEMSDRLARAHVQLFGLVTFFPAYDKPTQDRLLAETPKALAAIDTDFKRWASDARLNEEEKKKLAELAGLLDKYRKDTDGAINMVQMDVTSALGDMRGIAALYVQMEKAFGELNQLELRFAEKTYTEAQQQAQTNSWINVFVLLLAILIAGAIGLVTARKLLRQLGGEPALAAEIAGRIASGDLTVNVPIAPAGSLLAAMSTMRDGLRQMIARMSENSNELSSASEQLAGASRQVAQRSGEQHDAAATMATAIEEMSVSIGNVSTSAREASAMSTHSGDTAKEGAGIVIGAAQEMQNIAGSVQDVSDAIRQLGENARQISSVVTVIGEVANQTNLLALNAAIEAARAGEQGRGFAVVADEVRKLAERTSSSTKEIGTMITAIQTSSDDAVRAMETAAQRVAHGVELARDAGSAIGRIQDEAAQVLASVSEISDSLREQGTVTQDIASNVERIARMSDDNHNLANDSAAAAGHLQDLAHSMRDQVSRFRI